MKTNVKELETLLSHIKYDLNLYDGIEEQAFRIIEIVQRNPEFFNYPEFGSDSLKVVVDYLEACINDSSTKTC